MIGAGKMSKLAVGQISNRGFEKLYVMNRTIAHAEALAELSGVDVAPETVETNMIFLDIGDWGLDSVAAAAIIREEGVLASEMDATTLRLVTHRHFAAEQVPVVVEAFRRAARRILG